MASGPHPGPGPGPEQPPSPPRLAAGGLESSIMKLTRGHSCVLCQQRKVRCDKQKPCANCVKAQVECKVVPPQPPRRRKKKPHERDLIDRLRKYEALLSQHGVTFDPIAHDLRPSDHADDIGDLENDLIGLKTSPPSGPDPVSPETQEKQNKWFPYYREYQHQDMNDSSDEDYEGPTIHHAFDTMFDNSDGFPFVVGGSVSSVTSSHPSAIQIFQLWQVYINNVNPLLKITHIPTLQAQIISAGANTAKISRPMEVLMFAIYFIAVTSMTDSEVQSTFGEDRHVLLGKYHTATQQALVNAGFMRSTELMVLQALLLYLLAIRQYVDPRSLFCLIGIAVRIATRLGIHRDGAQFGLQPFEAEQRRRLWWQIVLFDKRIAEITGSAITALSSSGGDCRLPLNVNDSELSVHSKDPPNPYPGPTEMIFCLTRIELTIAASPSSVRPSVTTPGGTPHHKPRVQYSPSPASPDVVSHVANHNLPQDIEGYIAYIENAYLKHCDTKIPLQFFTLMMTRQALCKLHVVEFLSRGVSTETLNDGERDALFIEATRVVEYDNIIQSTETLQGFKWYTQLHFPLPAYIFLVPELRQRTTGDLCERAWAAICENHERRGMTRNFRSPVHIAFGSLFVKAWDAREAAELQLGRHVQAPKLVAFLRQTMQRWKRTAEGGPGGPNHPPGPPGTMGSTRSGGTPGSGYGQGPSPTPGTPATSSLGPGQGSQPGPRSMAPGEQEANAQAAMYAGKVVPQPGPQMGGNSGGVVMDDSSVMVPMFDGVNNMFGSALPEVDFGQMDWNYLLQYGGYTGMGNHAIYPGSQ
ncbi:hypothetical protein GQ53DRAFT_188133 [Thozetella sp. PMI_491]|nr:hypothetical protein GQ53DRAFT_188133 [Thozetella sp. PMI_491]